MQSPYLGTGIRYDVRQLQKMHVSAVSDMRYVLQSAPDKKIASDCLSISVAVDL